MSDTEVKLDWADIPGVARLASRTGCHHVVLKKGTLTFHFPDGEVVAGGFDIKSHADRCRLAQLGQRLGLGPASKLNKHLLGLFDGPILVRGRSGCQKLGNE